MYDQGVQTANGRRRVRYNVENGQHRARKGTSGQEQVRLMQLAVCTILFFAVFLWRGVFPQKLLQVRDNILMLISTDFDFEEAFSSLGESLAEGGTILEDFGEFCIAVFGTDTQDVPAEGEVLVPPKPAGVLPAELNFLSQEPVLSVRTTHYAKLDRFGLEILESEEIPDPVPEEETVQPDEIPAVPVAGTVVMVSDYDGQELPKNYTMDQLSLGELKTMNPVLGRLNSVYGYRDHPIDGVYHFHGGVDIGGKMGDPIAAFADGTVEYTGEDDSYGLYLQVDHGNGVKSFYAHCSKIEVVKGQTVTIGDTVARIGSTGSSTGPHLHLELKYNKMHLNPAYYVTFLEQ